jgi:hypothetical protein
MINNSIYRSCCLEAGTLCSHGLLSFCFEPPFCILWILAIYQNSNLSRSLYNCSLFSKVIKHPMFFYH